MTAHGTLDDQYLEWLYKQVGAVRNRNPARSRWGLLRQLYSKEFLWFIPNDDNRIVDGKELQNEFFSETGIDRNDNIMWTELGCSMLEMLIALAQRIAYEAEGTTIEWFWHLLQNLGIAKYTDDVYNPAVWEEVEAVLDRVIHRTYEKDGRGGLFPIKYPQTDQRKVELWYQASAYMLEEDRMTNGPK